MLPARCCLSSLVTLLEVFLDRARYPSSSRLAFIPAHWAQRPVNAHGSFHLFSPGLWCCLFCCLHCHLTRFWDPLFGCASFFFCVPPMTIMMMMMSVCGCDPYRSNLHRSRWCGFPCQAHVCGDRARCGKFIVQYAPK